MIFKRENPRCSIQEAFKLCGTCYNIGIVCTGHRKTINGWEAIYERCQECFGYPDEASPVVTKEAVPKKKRSRKGVVK